MAKPVHFPWIMTLILGTGRPGHSHQAKYSELLFDPAVSIVGPYHPTREVLASTPYDPPAAAVEE